MLGKNAKKWFSVACAGALSVGLLAGCGGGQKSGGDVIKIGANLEMTGGNATFGKSATNAAKLALKEVNEKGGVGRQEVGISCR